MTRKPWSVAAFGVAALSMLFATSVRADAVNVTGNIDMLELWFNGNVAFTLSPAVSTCNGQFILNVSDAGTKNQYAALLAAKTKGVRVRVYGGGSCGPAEGSGGSYNLISYVYLLDT